ncbi:MAG: aspartate aminotransferase family protein [Clostridiales bacterium]|nr:aspartate aminotransferase family protein [Clostridiales bacterium]
MIEEKTVNRFKDIKTQDQEYIASTYARYNLAVIAGKGAMVQDEEGKILIDFSSGIGVNALGNGNVMWTEAVKKQIDTLSHISNLYYTQPQTILAEELCKRTHMQKVFFGNSGAEANEGAIKIARKYSADKYSPQRFEIITLVNSFHGRTIATLAATGQDVFHKDFGPFPPGFVYAQANSIEDIKSKICERTCAIFVEMIQGEGGVIPLDKKFVEDIYLICQEKDILFMVDEVQTGVGRCGKFLCSEYYDIKPDIITLAKGLGGGLPIGAVLMGEKTQHTLGCGDHGTTFGGNPIVTAGAKAVIDTLDKKFLDDVLEKGNYIKERVEKFPGVKKISGKGLMLGISLNKELISGQLAAQCIEKGLIILTAKEKLRMLPPLSISYEEIDKGLKILKNVLKDAMKESEEKTNETPT